MKKYLFDKIRLNYNSVQFIPFRKASFAESFLACTNNTFEQDEWEFSPYSFRDFLKMLSKTKLNDDNQYNVVISLPEGEKSVSFELLIKEFAGQMYHSKAPNKNRLSKFYSSAYQIKQEAEADKMLLETEPQELI